MRTQVAIIGGGPSGLLLSQLLYTRGIDSVVLERQNREYVLARIRAGVLEQGLVSLMNEAGVGARLAEQGFEHGGSVLAYDNHHFQVPYLELVGKPVVVYGQTEVTRDLYDAREAANGVVEFNVEDVQINDANSDSPSVSYRVGRQTKTLHCDFVAGCDGFHGVSRTTIPADVRHEYEKIYPFGWLGILSETPPINHELIYCNSQRGFALCSMRNENLSRYYVQCTADDSVDNWSDQQFWDELKRRVPEDFHHQLQTGPSIEKSIAPLRSFVCEPMRWGKLFLCGDAAHIVPPTGAKGLNTAASDVHYLYQGLRQYYEDDDSDGIDRYSERALARVWRTVRFSWWMTNILHRFPDQSEFDVKMQHAELTYLRDNPAAQTALAENYVGLPY